MKKTKVVIAGIGGVGGYFGGLLAKQFENDEAVEISFLARGAHLQEIQKNGLRVIKGDNQFTATPTLATDKPSEIGIADCIIVSTKSYDLETIIQALQPCINPDTIILPLLNGVDSKERIEKILPHNIVVDGCVYIVSRLKQAGVIENIGNIQKLYFGRDNYESDKLLLLEKLFQEASVEASISKDISTIIWEKFIFISPTATATSYFDKCIGEVLADNEKLNMVHALIEEVKQVAKARQIIIADDITEKTLARLRSMPFGATSSMHSDFQNNKPNNELESLTGFVVAEGQRYNLEIPTYKAMYAELKKKNSI